MPSWPFLVDGSVLLGEGNLKSWVNLSCEELIELCDGRSALGQVGRERDFGFSGFLAHELAKLASLAVGESAICHARVLELGAWLAKFSVFDVGKAGAEKSSVNLDTLTALGVVNHARQIREVDVSTLEFESLHLLGFKHGDRSSGFRCGSGSRSWLRCCVFARLLSRELFDFLGACVVVVGDNLGAWSVEHGLGEHVVEGLGRYLILHIRECPAIRVAHIPEERLKLSECQLGERVDRRLGESHGRCHRDLSERYV